MRALPGSPPLPPPSPAVRLPIGRRLGASPAFPVMSAGLPRGGRWRDAGYPLVPAAGGADPRALECECTGTCPRGGADGRAGSGKDRGDWMVFCYNTITISHLLEDVPQQKEVMPGNLLRPGSPPEVSANTDKCAITATADNQQTSLAKLPGCRSGRRVMGLHRPCSIPRPSQSKFPITHLAKPTLPDPAKEPLFVDTQACKNQLCWPKFI